jgi:hypothetical protein
MDSDLDPFHTKNASSYAKATKDRKIAKTSYEGKARTSIQIFTTDGH